MASHDPEELFPKLDAMGLEQVEEKLALGAFGSRKVEGVKLWIAREKDVHRNTIVFPSPPDSGAISNLWSFYLKHWKWIWTFGAGTLIAVLTLLKDLGKS